MSLRGTRIGEFDQQITFQQEVESTNVYNEKKITWSNIPTDPIDWAKIVPMAGRDGYAADQLTNFQTVKAYCRYRDDLSLKMRFTWNGNAYRFSSLNVPPGYRDQLLEIIADLEPEIEV